MGRPQFKTSPNTNMVGLMLRLTRALWSTGKAVITESGFCFLKGLLEIGKVFLNGSELIKIGAIGLRGFMEMLLTSTSGRKKW